MLSFAVCTSPSNPGVWLRASLAVDDGGVPSLEVDSTLCKAPRRRIHSCRCHLHVRTTFALRLIRRACPRARVFYAMDKPSHLRLSLCLFLRARCEPLQAFTAGAIFIPRALPSDEASWCRGQLAAQLILAPKTYLHGAPEGKLRVQKGQRKPKPILAGVFP